MNRSENLKNYWSMDAKEILKELASSPLGLTATQTQARLVKFGPNRIKEHHQMSIIKSLARQFTSPLILILLFAAVISFFGSEYMDTIIVVTIAIGSVLLSFFQEYRAGKAVTKCSHGS